MAAITDLATATDTVGTVYAVINQGGTDKKITPTLLATTSGPWTPTLVASVSNPTPTYATQTGSYVKIGALVIAQFNIALSNISGGSGNISIGGLPFAAKTSAGYSAIGSLVALIDLTAGYTALSILVASGAQIANILQYGDNTGGAYVALGALSFTSNFVGTLIYEA